MKTIRILVAITIIAGFIRLFFWVLPTLGIFQFEPDGSPLPVNGASLVIFKNGKSIDAISLTMLKTGWSVVGEGWPLVILGVMVGYPIGELARRQFAIDKASKEAIDKCRSLTLDAFVKEQRAKGFLEEANAIHIELPQLRKEAKLARGKIFNMSLSAKDLQGRYEELRQKAESLERELVKAKAKIRRLERKFDTSSKEAPLLRPNSRNKV
jgi:hypothetical protein